MFGFAWVGPGETTFQAAHAREDEDVFAFQLDHSEGDFPMLSVEIKNPRRRLLDSPDIWAWLSQDGVPIFFGRLVAIPEEMEAEIVRLNFVARPVGYGATKRALADTLRVAPHWDPVWIVDERLDDPDVVLEARTQIWHIDRISHAVTVSDIIAGEDGTLALGDDGFIYESLDVRYGSPPIRKVKVDAEISWDQVATGEVDISAALLDAFGGRIASYTGQGLEADWPRPGTSLGGGWRVTSTDLTRTDGVTAPVAYRDVSVDALASGGEETVYSAPVQARFYEWTFSASMAVGYDVSRSRRERIRFELVGDVQSVFTEPGEEEEILVGVASQKVAAPIDEGGLTPIRDASRRSYVQTDRGQVSLQYLIALARAKLLARARAIEASVTVPFATALELSCRKNVTITDTRLPGGTAAGKVMSYRIVAGGDGAQYGEITIGCTIGTGGAVVTEVGTATYSEGYSEGYQAQEGATIEAAPGVTYGDLSAVPIPDDGVDFANMTPETVITTLSVANPSSAQSGVLSSSYPDIAAAIDALNRQHTEVTLELVPLTGGPFETDFNVELTHLVVPRTLTL